MRQNPHVRICGGPGSATTLVYPTAASHRVHRVEAERPDQRAPEHLCRYEHHDVRDDEHLDGRRQQSCPNE